jgi:glycosyltransferase involved in cell wall biosynthesis
VNKVYVLGANENWIIDRFKNEWDKDNADISTIDISNADVIWLMADFCWTHISFDLLRKKKVLTSIHHIVPEKFQAPQLYEFKARDDITDAYHVPNNHTRDIIAPLTTKPIHVIPYWGNQYIWKKTGTKEELRKKHGIPLNAYVIGSFQRDTEGAGIAQGVFMPKLEKGPDLLVDFIIKKSIEIKANNRLFFVVLAGWRREYVLQRMKKECNFVVGKKGDDFPLTGNRFLWFGTKDEVQLVTQETLNELYQCLDLYPITSRFEGGPQSLIESGLLDVPVISRDVGMATQLLKAESIRDDIMNAVPSVPNIAALKLPHGYEPYRRLLESI